MSSISSVTQPVSQPVSAGTSSTASSTTQPKFGPKDAEVVLFKTHLDQLWFETVLKAAWYEKPFALINYAWNRSDAVAKDEKFGKSIDLLNNKFSTLVNAVARRTLSADESAKAGVAPLQFANESEQKSSVQRQLVAEKAEKEFYDVFKTRCKELNVSPDSKEYGHYILAVKNKIAKAALDEKVSQEANVSKDILGLKMETLKDNIGARVYNDMVATALPAKIEEVTVDSFKKAIKHVHGYFGLKNSVESVEADIRNAIVTKFGKKLEERANAFTATGDNAHVKAFKVELLKAHQENEARIDAEVKALRGDSGFNGTLNAAAETLTAATFELNSASQAFKAAYATAFNLNVADVKTPVDQLVKLAHLPADLDDTKAKFITAHTNHVAADKEFKKLDALLKKDASFVAGQRNELNAQIAQLRGPNGNDGTVDAAFKKIAPALTTFTDAEAAFRAQYVVAYGPIVGPAADTIPVATLIERNDLPSSLNQVKADYIAAKEAHAAETKKYQELDAKLVKLNADLNALATKNGGDIFGGELVKVRKSMEDVNVTADAKAQADKVSQFLKELSTPVTEETKKARFDALHAIIGA